jgi:hypothetical protein
MSVSNLKMILLPTSSNKKTGDIIQSYSSRATCPDSCIFKKNGCYADSYTTSRQWERCDNPQDTRYVSNSEQLSISLKEAVFDKLRKNSDCKKVLFRHNVAGDIATEGTSYIDKNRVETIVRAIEETNKTVGNILQGYTYTHCKIDDNAVGIIRDSSSRRFLINASCETVREVTHAKSFGVNAVIASVNPEETKKELKAVGLHSVQCPAQVREDIDCNKCQLCAKNRKAVIIFKVHGNAYKKASKVIMMKKIDN